MRYRLLKISIVCLSVARYIEVLDKGPLKLHLPGLSERPFIKEPRSIG